MNDQNRPYIIVGIVSFVLGIMITFSIQSYFNGIQVNKYEQEIEKLKTQTNTLLRQLSMLKSEADRIKEEVKNEQANKSPDEITRYWNLAYLNGAGK